MSDLWIFSSSSPASNIHHSSLSDSPAVISSPPPLSSLSSFKNHGNHPHTKVIANHLPEPQEASPQLPYPQKTSPHLPPPQITSPHLPHSQVTSPYLHPPQVMSPHLSHSQVTSPHLPCTQVTSSYLHHPHVTSPHVVPQRQVTSPHLHHSQATSPHLSHSQVTSPHLSHSQVTSPHLSHSQATSPHLSHSQATSPHLSHSQVTSPHLSHSQITSSHIHYSQVTSPHLPHPQVASPHLHHHQVTSPHPHNSQGTSPHLPHPQVNSPHLASPQFTNPHLFHQPQLSSNHYAPQSQIASSYNLTHPEGTSLHHHQSQVTSPHHPHPHVTTPNFLPQPGVTSPNLVPQCQITSPHLLSPPQNHFSNQNHNPGLDNPNWSRSEPSPTLSCVLNNYSYSYQIQTTAQLDFSLQNQNEFSAGVTHKRDMELENTHRLPCNTHTLVDSGLYGQGDTSGPGQDTWEPLEPTLSELQCSPLGSISGGATMGRWSSVEFNSESTEDFSNTQFFSDSYHDNNAPQSFCSPTTPGPSPHYPQTPTISSPGPQMHPRKERLGFPTQTSTHVNTTKTSSCCLHESDSYPVTSDHIQHQPHETNRGLIPVKTEPFQDQSCFSTQGRGQDVSSAAQSPSLSAVMNWKGECGGRGKRVGGGGRDGQQDWTWINRIEAPGNRLQCTVCKRDFRSLPALNGHMRSHSGTRAATCPKKIENSSSPVQPPNSMVIPVSVPVPSRGASKCRSGQRRCSRLTPYSGGAVLYRSLMHLKEEEKVTRSNKAAASHDESGGEAVVGCERGTSAGRSHYTPPPMLCPHRSGPGLYCSLTRRQQRVQTVQLHHNQNGLNESVATETLTTGINKPRINVGRGFQAQIPPQRDYRYVHSDSHNALLLWTPWDKLECPVNQERVEAFLTMARSSVMPGGGVSAEYALHILSESRGDFLLTVEKLLSTPKASNNHTGWSAAERRLLVKSLQQHHKDFSSIQRDVQTKSLSQCVEFYYLWKKKLSLTVKIPAGLTITLPNTNGQKSSRPNDAS